MLLADQRNVIRVTSLKNMGEVPKYTATAKDSLKREIKFTDKIIVSTFSGYELANIKDILIDNIVYEINGEIDMCSYGEVINVETMFNENPELFV